MVKALPGAAAIQPMDPVLDVAEKKLQMGAKSASENSVGFIIPRLPFIEIPERTARVFPELAKWNRDNRDAMDQWRERTNAVLIRNMPANNLTTP